ncbi:MAG: hypothetical protein ABIE25_06390 [Thermoplasmatota archaeon]
MNEANTKGKLIEPVLSDSLGTTSSNLSLGITITVSEASLSLRGVASKPSPVRLVIALTEVNESPT